DTLSFRYFSNEIDPVFNLAEGYYEVVYEGECKYIIKHGSSLYFTNGEEKYPYSPASYVMVTDRFVPVVSKAQFIKLFGDKSDVIRKYIHDRRIRLRVANKNQIADILKLYESLQTPVM
ncbi:MAG TPA: hypothetical protein VMV74_08300, partial [Bacteroidales bacterium]|nr:hypothetical protein [Bacteroidales bacterium]